MRNGPPPEIDSRRPGRQAVSVRIVYVITALALRLNLRRPWRHLHIVGFQILGEIEEETARETRVTTIDGAFG